MRKKELFVHKNTIEEKLKDIRYYIQNHIKPSFWVSIVPVSTSRTAQQNSFFHGPLIDAWIRLSGYSEEEQKGVLKDHFLKTEVAPGTYYVKDTKDLTVAEMSEFIDKCIDLLFQEGGNLTDNEGQHFGEYKKLKVGGGK